MTWLFNNFGTILAALVLIAVVAWITIKLIKDKKNGKSSCVCNCAHCAMVGQCHKS